MHDIDIKHSDFHRIDLNLLVALDALLTECHVARAAERIFIGQPAMSHALARLRVLFDDELLVRSGKRMVPTDRALALAPRVRAWLADASDFIRRPDDFDLARAEGVVRMSAPDGLETLVAPGLVAWLRREAPGVRLRAQLLEVDHVLDALDADELDLAIVAVDVPLRSWHQRVRLLSCQFNYMYAPEQLDLPPNATLAQLATLDHVISSHRGEAASVVDACFAAQGQPRRVVATAASITALFQMLKAAPLVSIQPAIHAGLLPSPEVVIRPLPTQPPLLIHAHMVWHRRHDQHPLMTRVRQQVQSLMARVEARCPQGATATTAAAAAVAAASA
ncbi:LysR family transcriptional regulator [Aquabacterium sp.]|uniref:LysR family transcriptional regulator n=1 Tax=Aquabacterium sp. TaxID=1872578 RepID=UPI002487BA91|nr:LysR family transcriptional regulator [Aquabacterium sp.]MDI1348467.1 LysR family transcriptional regulator [Aquabacterium sp.]